MWPKWGSKFDKMQKKIDLSRRRAKGKHAKRMRCFPSFFLIGFTKCGTTDLYETLSFIPDIIHPITKEPQFWHWFRLPYTAESGKEHYCATFLSTSRTWLNAVIYIYIYIYIDITFLSAN